MSGIGRVGLWALLGVLGVGFLASVGVFEEDQAARPTTLPDRVDRYLDRVAGGLSEPGAYVEPRLLPAGAVTIDEALELDASARAAEAPVRLAVLPAARLRGGKGQAPLAPDHVVAELRERVGADGVYAAAVRTGDGDLRLDAQQAGEEGTRYPVAQAVQAASDCCGGSVPRTLVSFLDQVDDERTSPAAWFVRGIAVLFLLGAAVAALVWRRRYAARSRRDDRTVALLRAPLGDEIGELTYRAAALPPEEQARGTDLGAHLRVVHRLVARARTGHHAMVTAEDAEQVTRILGEVRYELAVVEALREGRPVPDPTPPCHLDPRHGPSVSVEPYTPTGGSEREVPVCASCRAALEVGQRPHIRRLQRAPGSWAFYWDVGELGAPYVAGYWPPTEAEPEATKRSRLVESLRR